MPTLSREELVIRLRECLAEAGAENTGAYVAFQERYGGIRGWNGRNMMNWGLIHEQPSYLPPLGIGLFDEEKGYRAVPLLQCVDADPQDALFLDEKGVVFDFRADPVFDSAENLFLFEEFLSGHRFDYAMWNRANREWERLSAQMIPVAEVADSVTKLYRWEEWLLSVRADRLDGIYRPSENGEDPVETSANAGGFFDLLRRVARAVRRIP